MYPKVNFRIFLQFLLLVGVAYLLIVSNVIEVMPRSVNLYSNSYSLPSKLSSDQINKNVSNHNLTYLELRSSPILQQELNVTQNFTIMTVEFFKYMASQLVDKPYAGVDNFTQYVMAKLNLKPLTKVKSIRPKFGPVLNDVASYQYPVTIKPCRYLNGSINLFVAIISAAGNLEKRSNLRKTWIRHLSLFQNPSDNLSSISISGYGFLIGQTNDEKLQVRIEEESKQYGDILQMNIIDNYYNLTLKSVGLVNWLYNYCSGVDFVFKLDDDIFLNVRNLGAVITKVLNRTEEIIYGSALYYRNADRGGKWRVSYEDWPWSNYPPYPTGGSVLFPGIVIQPLLAATQVIPFLPFEDSYLLGLCTEKANIKLTTANRLLTHAGDFSPCHVYNSIGWHAGSLANLNSSFWATENFYKNVTQCIQDRNGVNCTMNPFDYVLSM